MGYLYKIPKKYNNKNVYMSLDGSLRTENYEIVGSWYTVDDSFYYVMEDTNTD